MRRITTWSLVLFSALTLVVAGCDSGSGDAGNGGANNNGAGDSDATSSQAAGGDTSTGTTPEVEGSTGTAQEIPADCGYDEVLKGTSLGAHIENFKLKDSNNDTHNLHYDCGGEAKAVWIFLSTGWCGACNVYAKKVEEFYNAYKDDGLRVLWIVGEDSDHNPITKDTFGEYVTAHAPMSFTVVRDPEFNATYSYLDNTTPALPHQYILDAKTMELVFKYGGTGDSDDPDDQPDGEQKIKEMLGVE